MTAGRAVREGFMAQIRLNAGLSRKKHGKRAGGGVRAFTFIVLLAAFAVSPALAQSVDAPKTQAKKKPKPKPATAAAAPALPCARAQWKDDPVCFGENDAAALPLPSAGSTPAKEGSTRPGDITISPKAKVNQDSPQPIHGNSPDPHPSSSEFGGGLGVGFHF
jgi:hypothetical protein